MKRLEKEFLEHFLNTPFVSKNQIVIFMYNENIFEIDEIINKIQEILRMLIYSCQNNLSYR